MEYNDSQINERTVISDDYALAALLDDFQNGDRQAYNMLIKMLKRSEPKVEMAVRAFFAEGDALVAELVCQAYYPFVEALCKYKFREKSPQEITNLTNSVLRELVRSSAKLSPKQSLKNQLYQCICRRYNEYMTSDAVNSFGHQSAEKCGVVPNEALAEVKKASARQNGVAAPAPEPLSGSEKVVASRASTPGPAQNSVSPIEGGALPKPRRHGANSHSGDVHMAPPQPTVLPSAGAVPSANPGSAPLTEAPGRKALDRKAQDKKTQGNKAPSMPAPEKTTPDAKVPDKAEGGAGSILPDQDRGGKELPKLKGFPSGSHEVRNSGPYSDRLTKALARMAERDYDTYQIIVKHYFNRYSYQHLCHNLGNRPIVAVGLSLYRGLIELGRQVFGLK